MKKVYIGVGHGGPDSGAASQGFLEKHINLQVALACKDYLDAFGGIQTFISRTDDNIMLSSSEQVNRKAKDANENNVDLVIDIHHNAGGGTGTEIFYSIVGGLSATAANNCLQQIVSTVGTKSRGIKTKKGSDGRDYFGIIRMTKAPAILIECAFIDSPSDLHFFNTSNANTYMGMAIAKSIITTLNVTGRTSSAKCPTCGRSL